MLHIAVCDDDMKTLNEMEQILTTYCEEHGLPFKVLMYSDGTDLLASEEEFSIIFLDIEMQNSKGIEVAQKIRELDMNVPIVYVTSYTDYWRRAYKVHAFDFITKPFSAKEICRVMDDFLLASQKTDDETITLQTDKGLACFKTNDIYAFLFESKKKVFLYTKTDKVLIKENLTDIYSMLNKEKFYQTRRDCILNLKYVTRIQNEFVIVLENELMLPLAQKKKDEFTKKLSSTFVEKLKGRKT